jgi:monoamine oxidase
MRDVIVIGAGLAGLAAARDLLIGGADIVVLEARHRPGGRVEQTKLRDGRLVQLGGEVIGTFHDAYRELVKELGLTLEPSFPSLPGDQTWDLAEGRSISAGFPWMTENDRATYAHAEDAFRLLARQIDPNDPWSHPESARLDGISVGNWMRSVGATPNAVRARELAMLALAAESVERTSLLADLRKEAAAGASGFYEYDRWEGERVVEGSASVAERMADCLGSRIRYGCAATRIRIRPPGCEVITEFGERFEASAVLSALPVGPLRRVTIDGVSQARLDSLHRQRNALAAKVVLAYEDSFWERNGQNGTCHSEIGLIGGTWSQRNGILSCLVPPERLSPFLATPPQMLQQELVDEVVRMFGPDASTAQSIFVRRWGTDPWTLGYITAWRPGDVTAVGPLHGTHEPPFYVCGSDQWVCGYMEGAVRTGRAAAARALAD